MRNINDRRVDWSAKLSIVTDQADVDARTPGKLSMSVSLPKVAIVILTWNNSPDTLECLGSVGQLDYGNFGTIVVDNGSSDDTVRRIRSDFPQVEVVELRVNLGYAAGNNIGIQRALDIGADYILILNNDTLVAPTMLTELVDVARANSRIGLLGPLMYCVQPAATLFAAGSFIRWRRGNTINRGMFQSSADYTQLSEPEPVDYIAGCGVLVRRACLEAIGAFQADYYLNFEDADWGVKTWHSGYEVWYVPKAILWHKVSATLGVASPAAAYYMTRNALLFFWRNSPRLLRGLTVLRIMLRTLQTIGAWTLKAKYRNDHYRRLRSANWLALRDFLRGRVGKMGADVMLACGYDVG